MPADQHRRSRRGQDNRLRDNLAATLQSPGRNRRHAHVHLRPVVYHWQLPDGGLKPYISSAALHPDPLPEQHSPEQPPDDFQREPRQYNPPIHRRAPLAVGSTRGARRCHPDGTIPTEASCPAGWRCVSKWLQIHPRGFAEVGDASHSALPTGQ